MKDFFVSYNQADRLWAIGIRGWLEDAGYSVVMQQGDFTAGSNFVLEMDAATKSANRLIAVLSPDYLLSEYTAPEWAAMFALDPTGKNRRLVPVRIRDCDPTGLLKQIVHINLVGMDPDRAAKKLLKELQGKPSNTPPASRARKPNPRPRKSSPSQSIRGDGNVQVGGNLHVNSTVKTQQVIKPGPEHVSPKQAAKIRRLLQTLGQRDEKAGLGSTYGLWMEKFKMALGITSYHLLPLEAFDQAVSWIGQQKAITRSRLRRTDNPLWRQEHYGSIYAVTKKLKWSKAQLSDFAISKKIATKPFSSLKDLKERQLSALSAAIKRKARHPGV